MPFDAVVATFHPKPPSALGSTGFNAAFIQAFVRRRKELGLSQMELDNRIGVAEGLVAKWESGSRRPTLYNAWCWAVALGAVGFHLTFPEPDGTLEH